MGVSTSPSFSWGYAAGKAAKYQKSCRIVIRRGDNKVYDSGEVFSNKTQGITIDTVLEPTTKYTWDLYTSFDTGEKNESLGNSFITGIEGWQGKWITSGKAAPFYARKSFTLKEKLTAATAFVCGLGQFKLYINGKKAGNHELDPGWTDYDKSAQYVTFDITDMVAFGENSVGISVAGGWYVPQRDNYFYFDMQPFAEAPEVICDIVLEYADGSREVIATDESWRVCDSATIVANIYGSEFFDARAYPDGWNRAGFDDSGWSEASLSSGPKGKLVPQSQPPVTVKKVYNVVDTIDVDSTTHIFDLGQNMSGMFEIYVSGPTGSTVTITPAEKLSGSGNIDNDAKTALKYTLKGTGDVEVWRPDFSYAGGRWVRVEGAELGDSPISGKTVIHDVRGYFVTNSAIEVGSFNAADERYNAVFDLILKAIESNLQSVHTDCPIWERLGWLETSQLMGPGIMYNKDARELLRKIARDAAEAQEENGFIPNVAPSYPTFAFPYWDSPAWGSAGIIIPWLLYQFYGDTYNLKENYEAMKKYAAYLKTCEDQNGLVMQGLGDWGIEPSVGIGQANLETGIYYLDLRIIRDSAEMFGFPEDAAYFASEVERVKENYNKLLLIKNEDTGLYVYRDVSRTSIYDKSGQYAYNGYTQGAQAMALYLDDIIPDDKKDDIIAGFRKTMESGEIRSGEIALRFILQMAGKYGLENTIHKKVVGEQSGSYYRFVMNGETTLPEYWVDDARSRNHDMLGHVMEWFYNGIGGISPAEPGFEKIAIAPRPPQELEGADVNYESVKGKIVSSWTHIPGKFTLHAELPANTSGVITLPTFEMSDITVISGGHLLYSDGIGQSSNGIEFIFADESGITFEVENGSFDFELSGNEVFKKTSK